MSTVKTNRIENTAGTAGFDVATIPDGGGFSMRNKLINGGFDIWQRGTSFTSTGYTADRWYARKADVSRSTSGDSTKADVTATGTYAHFSQKIEDGWKLKGKQVTLSFFWEPISGCDDAYIYVEMENGTAMILGGVPNPTVTGQKAMTFNVPDDGNVWDYLEVSIRLNGSTLDFSRVHISKIQLEEGSVATPFEQRPIGMELSLCQRYYQVLNFSSDVLIDGYYSIGNYMTWVQVRPVVMRGDPTRTLTYDSYHNLVDLPHISREDDAQKVGIIARAEATGRAWFVLTKYTADAEL